jgi:hypothetical protein
MMIFFSLAVGSDAHGPSSPAALPFYHLPLD